jgi:hypothetical protein
MVCWVRSVSERLPRRCARRRTHKPWPGAGDAIDFSTADAAPSLLAAQALPAGPSATGFGVGSVIRLTFDSPLSAASLASLNASAALVATPDNFFARTAFAVSLANDTALLLNVTQIAVCAAVATVGHAGGPRAHGGRRPSQGADPQPAVAAIALRAQNPLTSSTGLAAR